MSPTEKNYYSKLLLFGEFITIKGAKALAIPFPKYHGKWSYSQNNIAFPLDGFAKHIEELNSPFIDHKLLKTELEKGLFFESNIPIGYGLGSSGAVVAAVFDTFGKNKEALNELMRLKSFLANLESYFHGSSSGTDPLICYTNRPILIHSPSFIETTHIPPNTADGKGALFLINTHIARETSPLVQHFLEQYEDTSYAQRCEAELFPLNEEAIVSFQNEQWTILIEVFHQISHFQFKYFKRMIPQAFQQLWLDGLSDQHFKLKICGAGGGGFILGICSDFDDLQYRLKNYELEPILRF